MLLERALLPWTLLPRRLTTLMLALPLMLEPFMLLLPRCEPKSSGRPVYVRPLYCRPLRLRRVLRRLAWCPPPRRLMMTSTMSTLMLRDIQRVAQLTRHVPKPAAMQHNHST